MTIRLLSPDLVRNRCDEVVRAAGIACGVLLVPMLALILAGFPKISAAPAALAVLCAGASIGAQLVGERLK